MDITAPPLHPVRAATLHLSDASACLALFGIFVVTLKRDHYVSTQFYVLHSTQVHQSLTTPAKPSQALPAPIQLLQIKTKNICQETFECAVILFHTILLFLVELVNFLGRIDTEQGCYVTATLG